MPVDIFGRMDGGSSTQRVISGGITSTQANNTFLRRDGVSAAVGNINLGSKKLINVADPTDLQDVATKNYVDTNKLSKSGDTMSGDLLLSSSSDPTVERNLGCGDLHTDQRFHLLLGNVENRISFTNNDNGYVSLQAANRLRIGVSGETAIVIQKTGGQNTPVRINMIKNINMSGNRIINLAEPVQDHEAATKKYVNTTAIGPAFSAYNTNTLAINGGVITQVSFGVIRFDEGGCLVNTNRFFPKKAGYYFVSAYVEFRQNSHYGNVSLYKTGTLYTQIAGGGGTVGSYNNAMGSCIVYLGNMDYLEIKVVTNIATDVLVRDFSAAYLRP